MEKSEENVDRCKKMLEEMWRIRRIEQLQFVCLVQFLIAGTSPQKSIGARREQVPFSMTIENGELMHECFPKHLRMGTARQKEVESNVESTEDTKKRIPVQSLCSRHVRHSQQSVSKSSSCSLFVQFSFDSRLITTKEYQHRVDGVN